MNGKSDGLIPTVPILFVLLSIIVNHVSYCFCITVRSMPLNLQYTYPHRSESARLSVIMLEVIAVAPAGTRT